jgi:hypothetical protein
MVAALVLVHRRLLEASLTAAGCSTGRRGSDPRECVATHTHRRGLTRVQGRGSLRATSFEISGRSRRPREGPRCPRRRWCRTRSILLSSRAVLEPAARGTTDASPGADDLASASADPGGCAIASRGTRRGDPRCRPEDVLKVRLTPPGLDLQRADGRLPAVWLDYVNTAFTGIGVTAAVAAVSYAARAFGGSAPATNSGSRTSGRRKRP